jgi:hypothetical protein
VTTFAGIRPEDVASFIERVDLTSGNANALSALDRWKELQREGWDVEALCAEDGSHMIGLGCLYPGQLALRMAR